MPGRANLGLRGCGYGGGVGGLREGAVFGELGGLVPIAGASSTHVRVFGGGLGGRLGGLWGGGGGAVGFDVLV